LRNLSAYQKYSKYIDGLMEVVALPKETIDGMNTNIKENWVEGADFII
jgi:hypothetical protein